MTTLPARDARRGPAPREVLPELTLLPRFGAW